MGENETGAIQTTHPETTDARATEERDDQQGPASLSRDDAYHLLQSGRRRAVLRYLLSDPDRDQFVMRDVAEAVAAWEHDTTVQRLTSDERQRVYISLYQAHLPKLDDHGIVEYNQPRGTIHVTPLAGVLEPLLDVDEGLDAPETVSVDVGRSESERGESTSPTAKLLSTLGIE